MQTHPGRKPTICKPHPAKRWPVFGELPVEARLDKHIAHLVKLVGAVACTCFYINRCCSTMQARDVLRHSSSMTQGGTSGQVYPSPPQAGRRRRAGALVLPLLRAPGCCRRRTSPKPEVPAPGQSSGKEGGHRRVRATEQGGGSEISGSS